MGISRYLAMTAAEIAAAERLPEELAYMACHFSPYGTGLSNCPDRLPAGAILILNDRTPISGHDPVLIGRQLSQLAEALSCTGVLLDLQRGGCPETERLCSHLVKALPCPVAVSDLYARELDCPVFLPPPPPDMSLAAHLRSWEGREIWLEAALEAISIAVTEAGSAVTALPYHIPGKASFTENALHCSYRAEVTEDAVRFCLWRTPAQLDALLEEAAGLGVINAIGLYQQLKPHNKKLPVE